MIKKNLLIIVLITFVLIIAGCNSGNNDSADSNPDNESIQNDLKYQNYGFKGKSVGEVRLASNGQVYVLSEGEIYYQDGEQWVLDNVPEEVMTFNLLESDEQNNLIAGTINGSVYIRSFDDKEWKKVNIDCIPQPISIITANSSNKTLYLGQSSKNGGGLWKSTDRGQSWEKLTDITVRGIAVHPDSDKVIYIVDRLTYFSNDGGINWTRIDTPANYGVLIHPLYPDVAYIAYSNGMVSTNHEGKISSYQRFYLPGSMTRLEYNPAVSAEWALGIWDYPSGTGGLYYSLNGGSHWIEVGGDLTNTRILDLSFDKSGRQLFVATADEGLWVLNIEKFKQEI